MVGLVSFLEYRPVLFAGRFVYGVALMDKKKLDEKKAAQIAYLRKKCADGLVPTEKVYRPELLQRMRFRVVPENVSRYHAFAKSAGYPIGSISQIIARLTSGLNFRATMPVIMKCASVLRVPPEFLIDGNYYYQKHGWCGYRVSIAVHEKGISFQELTFHDGLSNSDKPKVVSVWYRYWYNYIIGNLLSYSSSGMFLHIVLDCRDRLGITPADLLAPPPTLRNNLGGVTADLVDYFGAFDRTDYGFVIGAAKALHDYKYRVDGSADLLGNLQKLGEWWLGHEEEV